MTISIAVRAVRAGWNVSSCLMTKTQHSGWRIDCSFLDSYVVWRFVEGLSPWKLRLHGGDPHILQRRPLVVGCLAAEEPPEWRIEQRSGLTR